MWQPVPGRLPVSYNRRGRDPTSRESARVAELRLWGSPPAREEVRPLELGLRRPPVPGAVHGPAPLVVEISGQPAAPPPLPPR